MNEIRICGNYWYNQYILITDKSVFGKKHIAPFFINGVKFYSIAHYIITAKAKFFNDEETFNVLVSPAGHKCYKKYNKPKGYNPEEWDTARFDIALEGILNKFEQNPELKKYFLELPEDHSLVLTGKYENRWGIGMDINDPHTTTRIFWGGRNIYGNALSYYRDNYV